MKVFKYVLNDVTNKIEMPVCKVISTAFQGTDICIWVLFDEKDSRTETRTFRVIPTGVAIENNCSFVGTVFSDNSHLVFHVFEIL